MKRLFITVVALFLCYALTYGQDKHFKPSFGVVLQPSGKSDFLRQCSRSSPARVKTWWTPAPADIEALEINFTRLYGMAANGCCIVNRTVDSLQHFAYQYIGVTIKKKKYIYVNAFSTGIVNEYKESGQDPTKVLVKVCDGGASFWGVLFDPETKEFSELAFNGI